MNLRWTMDRVGGEQPIRHVNCGSHQKSGPLGYWRYRSSQISKRKWQIYNGRAGLRVSRKVYATASPPAPVQFQKVALDVKEEDLAGEAKVAYLQYSMSVIVGRALPDIRDGLKPVQRRILFAMHDMKLNHSGPFRKSARVVGEVLGKLHPHGDSSVYEAMVRMAQDFSLRQPLVNGHGNFGSIDGDPAAAMRYTECKLQPVTEAMMLQDLGEYSVDYLPNFDDSQKEPSIMPARLPQLLLNGSTGIAVGYATEIPPHNLQEIVAGLEALIKNPNIPEEELMQYIKGPDFPSGAKILGEEGIKSLFQTGAGTLVMRATADIETVKVKNKTKQRVVFTEIPFGVNKATEVQRIAEMASEGIIKGVDGVQDESGRLGIRVVVDVKSDFSAEQVMNQIFKNTRFQTNYSARMVALVDGSPQQVNIKQMLSHFVDFRYATIQRIYTHRLKNYQSRLHIVEGLIIAQQNPNKVIEIMQKQGTAESLMQELGLTKEQADAIMDMRIRSFTKLEASKLNDETQELNKKITYSQEILNSKDKAMKLITNEAKELSKKYGSPRRTQILQGVTGDISLSELIQNELTIVTLSKRGYIKRLSPSDFNVQRRGGRGKSGTSLKGDDTMLDMLEVMTHDTLLFFTAGGHAYNVTVYDIPSASRAAQGSSIAQVLGKTISTGVVAMLPGADIEQDDRLVLLTKKGLLKQTKLSQFQNLNKGGRSAIKLNEGDQLLAVQRCYPKSSLIMASDKGNALHVNIDQFMLYSTAAKGVRAMKLKNDAALVGVSIIPAELQDQFVDESDKEENDGEEQEEEIGQQDDKLEVKARNQQSKDGPWAILVTKHGYGMRQPVSQYKKQKRFQVGLKAINLRNDDELKLFSVIGTEEAEDDLAIASMNGIINRIQISSVPITNRLTKGSRIMKLDSGDSVQTVSIVKQKKGEEEVQVQNKQDKSKSNNKLS
eukprot:TRINITY_DN771_c1_g1_i2.p1 TRINITY_DN771_c1_g1~~TRINITY_DN771_c1_g1_i2.p1  ORF type:complete len:946 (-),score=126.06 TRINITY_DN771_c1_g1_i2:285-3122(-)